MIRSIRHRGLKRLQERGNRRRLHPTRVGKIEVIPADLDAAASIDHMAGQATRCTR